MKKLSWNSGFQTTALLFQPLAREPSGTATVVVDDAGKEAITSRLAGRARSGETILAVDLPGYGGSSPNRRGDRWGSDWKAAFLAFHLGRSLAGIRADAVRQAVMYVRGMPSTQKVRLTGIGRAALPALLAAAMEPAVDSVRLEDGLDAYASIVQAGLHQNRLGNTIPGALKHFDLPLLRASLAPREVEVVRPRGPSGELIGDR